MKRKFKIEQRRIIVANKKTVKRSVVLVPKDLKEAAKFVAKIAKAQRSIEAIKSDLNAEVDKLKTRAVAEAGPHSQKIEDLLEGLFAFAETNRDQLTKSGKVKSVKLETGIFGWRTTPPAVTLRNIKSIIKSLRSLKLGRFIRTKEEVDKEAMLKEPEVAKTVKGVSIGQYEEFFVRPEEIEVEATVNADNLRKKSKAKK